MIRSEETGAQGDALGECELSVAGVKPEQGECCRPGLDGTGGAGGKAQFTSQGRTPDLSDALAPSRSLCPQPSSPPVLRPADLSPPVSQALWLPRFIF